METKTNDDRDPGKWDPGDKGFFMVLIPLAPELRARVEAACERNGDMDLRSWIRNAIKDALERQEL